MDASKPTNVQILHDAVSESDFYEDDVPSIRESDFKHRQAFKGWMLLWLAYQSVGVIYGDIGTSPLYVYSSTFSSDPSYEDLLGALSLIIWSLTLIVTVKYVCIVLRADDEGEGGTFAMYNLLSRYCNIAKRDPKSVDLVKMERYDTDKLHPTTLGVRNFLENSRVSHAILKILAVLGVSLIMADGILTPAQSVLGAIQGLRVAKEDISTGTIIGVSCAILIILYTLQPLGITKLSWAWAPIVIVWFVFNFSFGIYNLVKHDWTVLKAFSPYFAGQWFVRNGTDGWKSLGGILLAFTGVEALFADMGAFTRRAVQISWLFLAYPCLLMAYIGQAAYMSKIPSAYSNPFFKTVPPGMFWPSLVVSILAAIVASQALITSTFQLLSQVMNASYFPRISMAYTSDRFHGQIYIPLANWLMMVGTVIVTAVYNNTTRLGNAYGVCVILVTFVTTSMIALVALMVWKLHWLLVLVVWLPFVTLDGLYMTAVMTKVPEGAWFTLLLAVILSCIFVLWRYGKEKQWEAEDSGRCDLLQIITKGKNGKWQLTSKLGGRDLTEMKGTFIFFDKAGTRVPTVYEEFVRKFEAQPAIQVFLHLRGLAIPHVSKEEMVTITRTALPNCYRFLIRHGYNDVIINDGLSELVYTELRKFLLASHVDIHRTVKITGTSDDDIAYARDVASSADSNTGLTRRLQTLETAKETQMVYVVGKEQLRVLKDKNNIFKRAVLDAFLWIRENTRTKVANLRLPVGKLVEIGFVKEL